MSGIAGGKVWVAPLMLMVAVAQWPQLLDDLGDGQSGARLDGVGDGQCGEHDGQVGFDGVAHAVEHRPGLRSLLDIRNDFSTCHRSWYFAMTSAAGITVTRHIGHVALEPDQGLGAGQAGLVEGAVIAADLHEPGGLGLPVAVDDRSGAGFLGGEGLLVAAGTFGRVRPDRPPRPRELLGVPDRFGALVACR